MLSHHKSPRKQKYEIVLDIDTVQSEMTDETDDKDSVDVKEEKPDDSL